MPTIKNKTALGFSVHTGWAMAVAVTGPPSSPKLLHRQRIELAPESESVEVFHVAAEKTSSDAKRHIDHCEELVAVRARAELSSVCAAIQNRAPALFAIAVVISNSVLPSSLDAILRSHMQIHSAEGDFYRRAILRAGESMKLKSLAVRSKEIASAGAAALAIKEDKLPEWLTNFGRTVGRPWGRDEKDAFLVACVALATL